MGIDEFVDLDIEEFQRRSTERLLLLVEAHRPMIEADLGGPFEVHRRADRVELDHGGRPVFVASTTAAGRLLLTDVSGRFSGRL
ncbi:MAG: hypothetical protein FJW83_10495 [Actinobacteria bacterium]|nr:hypothetical protein [Actinomycetota bacterium]